MGSIRGAPVGSSSAMAVLRLFAAARTAAGTTRDLVPGDTVAEVLASAIERYGDDFAAVVPSCAVWLNGQPAAPGTRVAADDEVAVLPPVSGGRS